MLYNKRIKQIIRESIDKILTEHDNYYTKYSDIVDELSHYEKYFANKVVMLCCDKPYVSKFWQYFGSNMQRLRIPMVVSTYWSDNEKIPPKMTVITRNGVRDMNLNGNGDFLSNEIRGIMSYVDIVVTNPPFSNSMFSRFLQQLKELNKKFIVIGPTRSGYEGKVFNMLKNGDASIGYNNNMKFTDQMDGGKEKRIQTSWFTNLQRPAKGDFNTRQTNANYVRYDNFNAINVDSKNNIPTNYTGMIGVPPSVISDIDFNLYNLIKTKTGLTINGQRVPKRMIIQRKR